MSIQVKPGRYRMRNRNTVTVENRDGEGMHPWRGHDDKGKRYTWADDGSWFERNGQHPFDLVEYLGPEQSV